MENIFWWPVEEERLNNNIFMTLDDRAYHINHNLSKLISGQSKENGALIKHSLTCLNVFQLIFIA